MLQSQTYNAQPRATVGRQCSAHDGHRRFICSDLASISLLFLDLGLEAKGGESEAWNQQRKDLPKTGNKINTNLRMWSNSGVGFENLISVV